jgi:hypothetical protein
MVPGVKTFTAVSSHIFCFMRLKAKNAPEKEEENKRQIDLSARLSNKKKLMVCLDFAYILLCKRTKDGQQQKRKNLIISHSVNSSCFA